MKSLGKGDSYRQGSPMDKGLSEQSSFDEKAKLRGETNEASQRPTGKTESVKSDRGSFKSRC